ncbi:lipopolysaccharide biosynthesis protein [Methylocystis sp. ATCC 49242]|uniref:lipopolysaccharide biosynthesis protein n=1 Tax=Methylocystis sp. ATCC 49242 TaxID=622637 RepID=UPI0001F87E0D|nr:lipopolysaccharide biosynthesis protein [Methylocystis sp. ATCC 49242]
MAILTFIRDRLARHRAAVAAVVAMSIKAGGALLTLTVFTLAARAMSADEFGRLAIWFNAMSFLAVAAVFGQDTLIARNFGEYAGKGDYAQAWGAYRFGWRWTLISGAVFVAGLIALAPLIYPDIARTALLAGAFFLFTQTALHYSSHSSRVAVNIVVSETNRELSWRLVLLVVVIWSVLHQGLTPAEFFAAAAIGQILSLGAQLIYMRRSYRTHSVTLLRDDDRKHWFARGLAMWQSAMVEAASLYFDVMLIGYFASPAVAGDYFVAARIANIFMMVLTGLNTYSFSHSANLYFSGQTQKLQDILRMLVLVGTAMVAPVLLLIYVFGVQILTIFGQRYAAVYPTVVVLATACFIMSMSGSASVILLTTGHEKLYSRVITYATLARVALTAVLAWAFGAFGAACGWALINAPLFMALGAICRRACGVDTSIVSVLTYLRARPRESATLSTDVAGPGESKPTAS